MNEGIYRAARIYKKLDEIDEEYIGIAESFEPGFQDDIETTTDNIILGTHEEIIEASEGHEIDPRALDGIDELKGTIYSDIVLYDGIEDDLQKLKTEMEMVEKVRNNILQAAYS
ncbi:hypothetical protein EA473_03920 [Natrarchaeobius chitinivorans]|uniref:Uncharacterized protein n=2 Tax=Natrarchaeobius chitinivorans TaxID=1679083 RepID=A0A3N6M599_NATCH|nr:hypothetical protein EA473_03920 [Natrarchaeobius chitinivorans]